MSTDLNRVQFLFFKFALKFYPNGFYFKVEKISLIICASN